MGVNAKDEIRACWSIATSCVERNRLERGVAQWKGFAQDRLGWYQEQMARADRLEAENKALRAAMVEAVECFDAALVEGLRERLSDDYQEAVRIAEDNRDRSIWGLVERRLLSATDAIRACLT